MFTYHLTAAIFVGLVVKGARDNAMPARSVSNLGLQLYRLLGLGLPSHCLRDCETTFTFTHTTFSASVSSH